MDIPKPPPVSGPQADADGHAAPPRPRAAGEGAAGRTADWPLFCPAAGDGGGEEVGGGGKVVADVAGRKRREATDHKHSRGESNNHEE